ncbi:hypothetical protein DFO67_1352 [Modicisalibacter xianhensis]|uniref:Uncharacterized protein n=1 Tax=Modicisalibacter xianhensis TaxID=442341 RepID=A0A4R8F8R6_9GAMM|nr:winged helix-turn-helix domain-containing protein [Halomonas xianhensis]TDX21592.1 hypothetical protein DFO67_1352 [Halomonas xianhensis]
MRNATLSDDQVDELIKQYPSLRQIRNAGHPLGLYRYNRRKAELARKGVAPEHGLNREVPDGFRLKGFSDMRTNEEGKPIWYKVDEDKVRQQEIMQAALKAMCEEIPREPARPFKPSLATDPDLLNCFVITDFHMGALSWADETGADWDMELAESTLVEWFRQAIALSPNAETALLAQISDLLHWDGFDAVTPASKHLLDADTRFPKLVRVAIRVLRRVIGMLLDKHPKLHIIMADANHDPVSQVWLREWLSVMYEDEPRVTVDTSPSPYNVYEFGDVAIFTHHGHKRKVSNVSEVFAAKFRQIFGRTRFAYAHTGHLHHVEVKENNLMIVEQHRTLAAADAYAARGGYLSGRDAKVITYHKGYGEVSRVTVSFDMVRGV